MYLPNNQSLKAGEFGKHDSYHNYHEMKSSELDQNNSFRLHLEC